MMPTPQSTLSTELSVSSLRPSSLLCANHLRWQPCCANSPYISIHSTNQSVKMHILRCGIALLFCFVTAAQECMIPIVILPNGVEMPQLVLGTAHLITDPGMVPDNLNFTGMVPERLHRSLQLALESGIRGIDTALIYRSHNAIRQVLGNWFAAGKLERSHVFIESKIFHGPAGDIPTADTHIPDMESLTPDHITKIVTRQFEQTLVELGVGYVDLMLLHWPAKFRSQDPGNAARRIAAWKVLESFYRRGWARAIGVSNFGVTHLEQLIQDGAEIPPMVNQIEASVFLQFGDIVEYCHAHGIVLQAYSPLGRGLVDITKETVVMAIAKKHNRNEGQIAMRYLVQLGYAVTFLSSSAERLVSNQDIFAFELDELDMQQLSALNRPDGSWGLPSPDEMA